MTVPRRPSFTAKRSAPTGSSAPRAPCGSLWTADPPSYYTEGRYVKLVGALYTAAQRVAIERRYPEWSPHRHMAIDAIQRAAVRDLLALHFDEQAEECSRCAGHPQRGQGGHDRARSLRVGRMLVRAPPVLLLRLTVDPGYAGGSKARFRLVDWGTADLSPWSVGCPPSASLSST